MKNKIEEEKWKFDRGENPKTKSKSFYSLKFMYFELFRNLCILNYFKSPT